MGGSFSFQYSFGWVLGIVKYHYLRTCRITRNDFPRAGATHFGTWSKLITLIRLPTKLISILNDRIISISTFTG